MLNKIFRKYELHTLHNQKLSIKIRDVLKNFSSVMKAQAKLVQFVFVTGVSAFSKSGLSSGLNNLDNLTMNERFFDICGYTDEEVDLYFQEHIKHWAGFRKIPYEEIRKELKNWYNGYRFKENTPGIYSPFSLTCALNIEELRNFWFESATPQFLLDELSKAQRQEECNILRLEELKGDTDLLQTFEIENIPLTALLYQMGYLTIRHYNKETHFYELAYPNFEVKTALHKHLVAVLAKTSLFALHSIMADLFSSLIEENTEKAVQCIAQVFHNIPYQLYAKEEEKEQGEHFYHAILQALFIASGMKAQAEYSTNQGRADIIIELQRLLYVIEIKVNKPAEEGILQIEQQNYHAPFLHLKKPIRALAISFQRKKQEKSKSHFSITYATKRL